MSKKKKTSESSFETDIESKVGSGFDTGNHVAADNGSGFGTEDEIVSSIDSEIEDETEVSGASSKALNQVLSDFDTAESSLDEEDSSKDAFVLIDRNKISHTLWGETPLKDQGAMGVVSTATLKDGASLQKVLIKRIQGNADANKVKLFGNEAKITCQYGSKGRHLANGQFMGKDAEGRLFLVMDFYAGENLEKLIEQKTFEKDTGKCKKVIRGILEGLNELHEQGIVHRDLKPANVMVRSDNGVPVLLDFGLAKQTGLADLKNVSTSGTFGYAAPEQQDGCSHKVDYSADIYSVGVMFLEMLIPGFNVNEEAKKFSGKIDRKDPQRLEKLKARLDDFRKIVDAQIAKLDDNNAGEFKDFIVRCLEKNPEDRYQSGQDALEQFISIATLNHNEFKRKCIDPYWDDGVFDDEERKSLIAESKKMGVSEDEIIHDFEDAQKTYGLFQEHIRQGLRGNSEYTRESLLKEAERKAFKPLSRKDFHRVVEEQRIKLLSDSTLSEKERKLVKKSLKEPKSFKAYASVAVLVLVLTVVLMNTFFKQDENPIPKDPMARNALLLTTSEAGDAIYTSRLLKAGAFVNTQDSLGRTPLYLATALGAVPTVDTILNHEPNVNLADKEGWTPLFKAAWQGSGAIVKRLMDHGADVGLLDKQNRSAIALALRNGHDAVVLLMLKSMDDADIQKQYETLMSYANTEVSRLYLAEAKEKVSQIKAAIGEDNVDKLKAALAFRSNADLNYTDEKGWTWLHFAASCGSIRSVKYLTSLKMDVNAKDSLGQTPIFMAGQTGSIEMVRELVAAGADIQVENAAGKSFLSTLKSKDIKTFVTDRMYADSLFVKIAATGNQGEMERYMAEGAHVDAKDKKGNSALAYAVQKGDLNTVKFLLSKGARVNDSFEKGNSLVHFAAKNGDISMMNELLAAHADYNARNSAGQTPLMVAVNERKWPMVDLLFVQDSLVLVGVDNDQNNLVHYAAKVGNLDLMKRLQSKLDFNVYNKERKTPLHLAAATGSLECVQLLEEVGVSLSFKDAFGKKAVDYARVPQVKKFLYDNEHKNELIFDAVKRNNYKTTQELISFGANVNGADALGVPLLHYAVNRDTMILSLLLNNRAEVNALNSKKENALFKAVRVKNRDAYQCLIRHGANATLVNDAGETLLHEAVNTRDSVLTSWILNYVPVNSVDQKKETALFSAIRNNDMAMATFLMKRGVDGRIVNVKNQTAMQVTENRTSKYVADVTYRDERFLNAVQRNDLKMASYYLSLGANVNALSSNQFTAACTMARANAVAQLRYLVKNGADLNTECAGLTPLGWSVQENAMQVLEYLVKLPTIKFDHRQSNGKTALQMAVLRHNWDMAKMLLPKGGVNAVNNEGKTALILAIEGNQFDLVKLLLDGGASQGWRAPNGEAPIHVAARSASGDIARLLISHGANVEEENADGDDPLDIAKNYGNTSAESVIDDAHSWSVWIWIKYISIAVLIIAAFVSCCIYKWLIAVYVVLIVLFVKFCAG